MKQKEDEDKEADTRKNNSTDKSLHYQKAENNAEYHENEGTSGTINSAKYRFQISIQKRKKKINSRQSP